ncbi:MAG: tRNA lysidine(34) synthetase TilS, partial [Proteobacteria bacterium]|nr:tRNA lysidine(34) synthetase TilS [Pseudomonadota bacterium]
MARLGPFEEGPIMAVGVSGGPDSMALCALADTWARARGGRVMALVVDHALRPESGDEARRVGRWLGDLGVDHVALIRDGPAIRVAVHAAARAARYGLMGDYCRDRGILHLAVAHHRDDQAETLLLRLDRASGLDGLAAMAAVVEGNGPRLLRPLLAVSMARLR